MSARRYERRLRETFSPGAAVTLYDAQIVLGDRWRAAERALDQLVLQGELVRLAPRLWVRLGADPDPYKVGARITFPYAFACATALALHGRGEPPDAEIVIASPEQFATFAHAGVVYRHAGFWVPDDVIQIRARTSPKLAAWFASSAAGLARSHVAVSGQREHVWVTDLPRTLRDCLAEPASAGQDERVAAFDLGLA
jgi:hypothetical protein